MNTDSIELLRASAEDFPSRDALMVALEDQHRLIAELQARVDHQNAEIREKESAISTLEERIRLLTLKRFAPSSEKSHPGQGELFNEAESAADGEPDAETGEEEEQATPVAAHQRKSAGRKGLNPDLPRERVDILLSEAQRAAASKTFFIKVKEELDIEPARARVIEYWQEKAVVEADGEQQIVVAERTPHPLGKCIASVNLLAWIIVAKYADGLPLNRLESILKRCGGQITRTAMANWVIRLADVLQPLLDALHRHQMQADYLQGDETTIQVHKEPGKNPTGDKWMWLLRGGPPDKPVVAFHYDPSRSGEVAARLLEDYSGRYFQSDGYSAYAKPCAKKKIVHLGCWDHARRYFRDAQKAEPAKKKSTVPSKATVALSLINKLYVIERDIADKDSDERFEARQERSLPALAKIKAWCDTNAGKVLPDSLTGKAINYVLRQWPKLTRYTEHGDLHISNCLAENAIRPFVIGRKGWLFADTPKGAHASACMYTLIETAKANGVEPYGYLCTVIGGIATARTAAEVEALLPWRVS